MQKWTIILGFLLAAHCPFSWGQVDRIVSINFCTDELLLDLVSPGQIAGLGIFSQNNRVGLAGEPYKHIRYIRTTSEEIFSLNPHLVIAGTFSNHKTVEMIERLGIPVLRLQVPQTFDEVYANLKLLGEHVQEESKAEAIIQKMKLDLLNFESKKNSAPPTVILIQDRGFVAGQNTFENVMIEKIGAVNLAARLGVIGHQKISFETLVTMPPDVIIFTTDQKERESLGRELLSHPVFREGLKKTRFYFYPINKIRCASPSSVSVLGELKAMIYEE